MDTRPGKKCKGRLKLTGIGMEFSEGMLINHSGSRNHHGKAGVENGVRHRVKIGCFKVRTPSGRPMVDGVPD